MPKEILIGGDAVKMKSLPDFIKDRLSTASVEMLEDSRYDMTFVRKPCSNNLRSSR